MSIVRMNVGKFRAELLEPAHDRAEDLRGQVRVAERELENLLRAVAYDDVAAATAQRRLEEVTRAHERYRRRWQFLEGCLTGKDGGDFVTIEEAP
jgi:hypothetical protein